MRYNLINILDLLDKSESKWLRVNEEKCLHKYFDRYYILLCHWFDPNINNHVIYLEIDDIEAKVENVIEERYQKGTSEYEMLLAIYNSALKTSVQSERYDVG